MQKRLLLLVSMLTLTICSMAQLSISTSIRQDAIWDELKEDWEVVSIDSTGTFFEFNTEFTMFKHTTETITSNYKITSTDYDEKEIKYTLQVVSDVGNEYEVIIDGTNNYIAFFYERDEEYILVHHTIKKTWIKDDK